MIPTWISSLTATPSAINLAFSSSNNALAPRKSFNVAIIGNMIRNLPYTEARNNARNCVRNISGSFNEIRIARYPKNGFISCGNGKYGNSLSPPISIVRTTTGFPFMPSKTAL